MKHKFESAVSFRFPLVAIVFAFLLMSACKLPPVEDIDAELKADFDVTPSSGNAPLTVTITNKSAGAVSWAWSFGDGENSNEENPGTHRFDDPGNFTLRLIITDARNNKDTTSTTIIVSSIDETPEAGFTVTNNGCTAPCSPQFINTTTNATEFLWDFGDPASGADNSSIDVSPSHEYKQPGTYNVKLKATNGSKTDSVTQVITIVGIKFELPFAGYGAGAKACQLSDGGYIMAGTQNSNAYLIRTDAHGEILNQRVYTGFDAVVNDVIQLSDGTFVVVGTSFNDGAGNTDFFYLRAGSNLAPLTGPTRFGENDGSEEATSVLELTDGSVLITGYSFITATQNTDVYVARYSPDLSTTFFKKRITAPDHELGYDALEVTDGYIIVGDVYGVSLPSNALFLKLDNAGNKVTGFPKSIGGSGTELALSVVKISATELMLGGQFTATGTSDSDVWLQKTNLTGSTLGAATIFGTSQSVSCQDITATTDGGIAVAGSDHLDAYLAKVNASGVQTINRTFLANGTDGFNSIQQTSDGGYILCGYKNSVLYLVKTDHNGNSN